MEASPDKRLDVVRGGEGDTNSRQSRKRINAYERRVPKLRVATLFGGRETGSAVGVLTGGTQLERTTILSRRLTAAMTAEIIFHASEVKTRPAVPMLR